MKAVEIICAACGAEAFLRREALYEGLKKTGDRLLCSACGFEYASEADVPFKEKAAVPQVFTEADRSAKVELFEEGETRRFCRYCAQYVVNPFMQFCAYHKREVQATDTCPHFSEKDDSPAPPPPL